MFWYIYVCIYIDLFLYVYRMWTTTPCSLKRTTPTLTLTTTAMQMLPRVAATRFEHRGPQCLLTLGRSTSPRLDQFPVRVCSCPLGILNRLWTRTPHFKTCVFLVWRCTSGQRDKQYVLLPAVDTNV